MKTIQFILGAAMTAAGTSALAQGIIAGGDISGGSGSGPDYSYSLSISDGGTATSPIGSFWYAWTPGSFYLPGVPISAFVPNGWSYNIFGDSIQFTANGASDYIAAGSSLSGFGFTMTSPPSAVEGNDGNTPVGTSVAYGMGLFSSPSDTFVVSPTSVPEPSSPILMGVGAVGALLRRRK